MYRNVAKEMSRDRKGQTESATPNSRVPVQVTGGRTTSPTLLGPVLVWSQQNDLKLLLAVMYFDYQGCWPATFPRGKAGIKMIESIYPVYIVHLSRLKSDTFVLVLRDFAFCKSPKDTLCNCDVSNIPHACVADSK